MVLAQKQTDQGNSKESPEINPHMYVQLVYDHRAKNIKWGRTVSSRNGARKLESLEKKNKMQPLPNTIYEH